MTIQNLVYSCRNVAIIKVPLMQHVPPAQQFSKVTIQHFKDPQSDPSQINLTEQKEHRCTFTAWHLLVMEIFHHIEVYCSMQTSNTDDAPVWELLYQTTMKTLKVLSEYLQHTNMHILHSGQNLHHPSGCCNFILHHWK